MSEKQTNAVARLSGDEFREIVVADPFCPAVSHRVTDVQTLIKRTSDRVSAWERAISAVEIDAAPIAEIITMRRDIEADDAVLKDYDRDLKEALLDLSGFKAFVVQVRGAGARIDPLSMRGRLAKILSALKAREDAEKPTEKPLKQMLVIDATPSAWRKIESAISKAGVKIGFKAPLASAKRIEAVGKIIKAIEADEAAADAAMAAV